MRRFPASVLMVAITLLGLLPALAQPAETNTADAPSHPDKAQLQQRFESIGTLIERSSAARQIESNGNSAAQERHNSARQVYQRARETFAAGDLRQTAQLLTDASLVMFDAVRLADPPKNSTQKTQADFNSKLESVKALLAAQKRISVEKAMLEGARETTQQIESELAEAQSLAAADHMASARVALEGAYLLAKASISAMRSGDTLVRSLNFASKEEEYRYELDRNDTHLMLIKLLVEEKHAAPKTDERMRDFVDNARNLRGQAEADAGHGNFPAAILLLEESTAEIIKAIRNAGIYIPG